MNGKLQPQHQQQTKPIKPTEGSIGTQRQQKITTPPSRARITQAPKFKYTTPQTIQPDDTGTLNHSQSQLLATPLNPTSHKNFNSCSTNPGLQPTQEGETNLHIPPEVSQALTDTNQSVALKKKKRSEKLTKQLVFGLAGLLSIYPYFMMIAEADIMDQIFANKNYNFFVLIPTYVSIPAALFTTKLFSECNIHMTTKVLLSLFLNIAFFGMVPAISLLLDGSKMQVYLLMLFSYFLCYIFSLMFQGYLMTVLSVYDSKWTALFVTTQALANIVVIGEKSLIVSLGVGFAIDFAVVWGTYVLLCAIMAFFFLKLTRTRFYQFSFTKVRASMREIQSAVKFVDSLKLIKDDVIGMLITMGGCFVIFPGIFFSFDASMRFSQQQYILFLNILAAFFDFIFRPFGNKKWTRSVVKCSAPVLVIVIIYVIYLYLTDQTQKNPDLVYLIFVLISFTVGRTSLSKSYYMIHSNQLATSDTKEGVGSIMINSLQLGMAIGNLSSNGILFLKSYLFKSA